MSENNNIQEHINELIDNTCNHLQYNIDKLVEEKTIEKVIEKTKESIKNIDIERFTNNQPEVKMFLDIFNNLIKIPKKTTVEELIDIRILLDQYDDIDKDFISLQKDSIDNIIECKKLDTNNLENIINLTNVMINNHYNEIKEYNKKISKINEKIKIWKSLNKIYNNVNHDLIEDNQNNL